ESTFRLTVTRQPRDLSLPCPRLHARTHCEPASEWSRYSAHSDAKQKTLARLSDPRPASACIGPNRLSCPYRQEPTQFRSLGTSRQCSCLCHVPKPRSDCRQPR